MAGAGMDLLGVAMVAVALTLGGLVYTRGLIYRACAAAGPPRKLARLRSSLAWGGCASPLVLSLGLAVWAAGRRSLWPQHDLLAIIAVALAFGLIVALGASWQWLAADRGGRRLAEQIGEDWHLGPAPTEDGQQPS